MPTARELAPSIAPADAAGDEFAFPPAPCVWSPRQRRILWLARHLVPRAIAVLGLTLRFELPHGLPPGTFSDPPQPAIYVFWHRYILPIAWYARGRNFGVLISQHFDGELIAQAAERLGYRLFRGSSTHGGRDALEAMTAALAGGQPLALTVDGPRGPRFRAKPGMIQLARSTGAPIYALHPACARAWTLRSWDRFQVPKPFTLVRGYWAGPYHVPRDASPEQAEGVRLQIESALNRLRAEHSLSDLGPQEES